MVVTHRTDIHPDAMNKIIIMAVKGLAIAWGWELRQGKPYALFPIAQNDSTSTMLLVSRSDEADTVLVVWVVGQWPVRVHLPGVNEFLEVRAGDIVRRAFRVRIQVAVEDTTWLNLN